MKSLPFVKRSMTASEIAARVSEVTPLLLQGLGPDELAAVLGAATLERFRANTVITREGQVADRLFLMLEGRARAFTTTEKGEKLVILWFSDGDGSGGRALLSKSMKYLLSTEVVRDSTLLMWSRSTILSLTKRYPALLENALLIASDYVEICRDMHVAARYRSAHQRIAQVLDGMARIIGRDVDEGIELSASNEEVAHEANVTIFTVSRVLNEWQRQGLLIKGRGRVILRSPETLVRSTG